MDVSQNMSYAYIVKELVKTANIDTVMIISRRDFFRKAAKLLPILMLSVSSCNNSFIYTHKGGCSTCSSQCNGSCEWTCNNCKNTHKGGCSSCSFQCKGRCEGTCMGTCRNTGKCDQCSDICKGSCHGSCYGSCQSSAKGKDTIRFKW